MLLIIVLNQIKSHEQLFWVEGDIRVMPTDYCHDATARHVHRNPSGRRRDHEEKTAGTAQHRHRY